MLTRPEQRDGQKKFIRSMYLNPLGVGFTFGPPLLLCALHFGANDVQMGLLYSAFFITGLVSLIAPYIFNGWDTSTLLTRSWLIRAFIGIGFFAIPFIDKNEIKVWLLIVCSYSSLIIRSLGMTAWPAIQFPTQQTTKTL